MPLLFLFNFRLLSTPLKEMSLNEPRHNISYYISLWSFRVFNKNQSSHTRCICS